MRRRRQNKVTGGKDRVKVTVKLLGFTAGVKQWFGNTENWIVL